MIMYTLYCSNFPEGRSGEGANVHESPLEGKPAAACGRNRSTVPGPTGTSVTEGRILKAKTPAGEVFYGPPTSPKASRSPGASPYPPGWVFRAPDPSLSKYPRDP
ncbi:hypothetical protein PCANC_07829 [Puccinia coronata f. sp. avenae]|uniref:Uncharacterized protein n=1 Tax=Puccinia coronata f. sp. avenae TaxID=200324 RepID=A0A2N5SIA3_9BASI|nr:hypothetical protein PCANC_17796 [Puccinia coronata f. sp. avenae]PLW47499.1 hypothetical protein PCANC_07829 [Puccinia coronata f. sp. avenae]